MRYNTLFQGGSSRSSGSRDTGAASPKLAGAASSGRLHEGALDKALSYAKDTIQNKAVK